MFALTSHLHRTGEVPQGFESTSLLSLKYICEYFQFFVNNFNQHFMEESFSHDLL